MSHSWPLVPLGDILKPVSRPEVLHPERTYRLLGAHWYATGLYVKDTKTGAQIQANTLYRVEQGDFVYNRLFAWKGSFAVATPEVTGCYVSNEFPCFTVHADRADASYLWAYFKRTAAWDEALGLSSGSTPTSRNRLKEEKFLALQIPLPPLSEQRRIVARIEAVAAKIEEARELRRRTIEEVAALIDSTLGRLINEVCKNPDCEEGPLSFYAEINPSRRNQIHLAPSDLVSFVPMSAVDDVTGAIVRAEDRPYAEIASGFTWFRDDDIIFARITPCMQNGKAAHARKLTNGTGFGSTEFHVIRPRQKVIPEWIYTLVRHKDFRKDAAAHFKGTAGQQRVPQSFLEEKTIPVPPLPEQRRIVAYLDGLQAKADALKALQAQTAAELDALLPAVLDRAFRGEL
jgi:type I restriction enzyme, S subunit